MLIRRLQLHLNPVHKGLDSIGIRDSIALNIIPNPLPEFPYVLLGMDVLGGWFLYTLIEKN